MNETIRRGNISLAYALSFFLIAALVGLLLAMALQRNTPQAARVSIERAPVPEHPFFKDDPPPPEVKEAPQVPPQLPPPITSGPGFPASRVRPQHLLENWKDSPEAYLTSGRIVLRDFQVQNEGEGMRISGRIWSDFEVEPGQGHTPGQLTGLKIEVGLYEISSDLDDRLGALVPGQQISCEVNTSETAGDIELGVASFSLPQLIKPLPPGIYRLVCKLVFTKQTNECKAAMMWVANLYGVTPNYDQSGHPTGEVREIYGSKDHKDYWKDLTENEVCKSQGTLFLGDTLIGGVPTFTTSNVLCRDPCFDLFWDLTALETQRAQLDDQYAIDRRNQPRDDKIEKRLREDYRRSVQLLDMLAARAGGSMSKQEYLSYTQSLAATKKLREAIAAFEDDLTYKYWIALDTFHYAFHTINKAGYNCSVAIDKGDHTLDRIAREKKQQEVADPIMKVARDAKREEAFRYIPKPIRDAAYEYFRLSEETPYFDSESFTRKLGKEVQLDPEKWSEFRVEFLKSFGKQSSAALAALDLSGRYAIQKWGDAYKQLVEVRDSIITHAYCYECYLRMIPVEKEIGKGGDDQLRADAEKQLMSEWEAEAGEHLSELQPLFKQAKVSPSSIYGRFESASKQARKLLNLSDFAYRYGRKVK